MTLENLEKAYKCTDCKEITCLEDNGEIRVGFCKKCGHPLWNPANDEDNESQKHDESIPDIDYLRIYSEFDTF